MSDFASVSRRAFLQSSGALAASASMLRVTAPSLLAIAQAACTARDEGSAFTVLDDDEAADVVAIAARIIPTTDTPGATEAGVVYFFDRALGDEMRDALEPLRAFLEQLNDSVSGGRRFGDIGVDEQDSLLEANQDEGGFELCRVMTIFGFFAMPAYGGNRGQVAWNLVGFQGHQGAWSAPFGYYDAEVTRGQANGE